MKTMHVVLGIALILAGAIWTLTLAGRDERAIRRTFRDAVQALAKDGAENPVAAARRADTVAGLFVQYPDVSVPWPGGALGTRADIRSTVFQVRSMLDTLRIRVEDLALRVQPDRVHATLRGTVRVGAAGGGDSVDGVQEFESEWIRSSEGWRVSVLRTVEAIRHPLSE